MLAEKIEKALNEQLTVELQSAHAYLSMSAYCEFESLPGMASWLRAQAKEEVDHAMRFFDYINDRDGRVRLDGLSQPQHDFSSPLDVFEAALENERSVTRSIADLYSFVVEEKDYASQALLDWFATEQVEEEKTIGQIVDTLRRIGQAGDALFIFDRELGQRSATAEGE